VIESEFIASIDCAFPYLAPVKWRRTVAAALNLSPNSVFMVVHELCRPPKSYGVRLHNTWQFGSCYTSEGVKAYGSHDVRTKA